MSEDLPYGPADYIMQQLSTIHDRRLWQHLERGSSYETIVQRLRVLAFRRPSLRQWLLGIDDRVGATKVLLIMDPDGVSQTIEVYFVRPPANS